MGKDKPNYRKFLPLIPMIQKDNPGISSYGIASIIADTYPHAKLKLKSLAAAIRKNPQFIGHPSYISPEKLAKANPELAERRSYAKVLIFDIETAPIKAYTWDLFPKSIGYNMILQDWFILSWSAKWLFDDKIYTMKVTPEEALKADDERVTRGLWEMLNEADYVVAHNLIKFDKRRAQTRFLKYRLGLPAPYQSIDTYQHAKRAFAVSSNRLDYLATFLGVPGKKSTSKDLWLKCMEGDPEALTELAYYCDQDVLTLEDVFIEMRPYIQPFPNIGLHVDSIDPVCPACGSSHLEHIGHYETYVNIFDAFRCTNCKSISRSRKKCTPKNTSDRLLVSIPK